MALPVLTTSRLRLTPADPADAVAVLRYSLDNQAHLAPWEPLRGADFFTEADCRQRLLLAQAAGAAGQAAHYFLRPLAQPGIVMGNASLSAIQRGPAQFCFLGYGLAAGAEGLGYMHEALTPLVAWAFSGLKLHRIMANYLPRNERSGRLLARLGFVKEGLAKRYLRINGVWEDHVLTSLTNENWRDG